MADRWGLALLLLLLAACAGSSEAQQAAAPTETTALPAGTPPVPDQATADAYIAALDALDPGIVHRHPADEAGDIAIAIAIDRGRSQCSSIYNSPGDRAYLIETARIRFTSPEAPDNGTWPAQIAERILDVVHQHLCPTY